MANEVWPTAELANRLLRRGIKSIERVYKLVAASVCFPTGWTLADKMGGSIASIHAPIPNYDTQLESTMDRFFDRIKVDRPVVRLNWNLMTDPSLYQPRAHIRKQSIPVTPDNAGDHLWLRVERQTLRRLPQTQDILFTIRILVRPLRDVATDHEEATRLVAALQGVPPEVRAYKGLPRVIDAAVAWLEAPPADG